jgi:hypothetical protein
MHYIATDIKQAVIDIYHQVPDSVIAAKLVAAKRAVEIVLTTIASMPYAKASGSPAIVREKGKHVVETAKKRQNGPAMMLVRLFMLAAHATCGSSMLMTGMRTASS